MHRTILQLLGAYTELSERVGNTVLYTGYGNAASCRRAFWGGCRTNLPVFRSWEWSLHNYNTSNDIEFLCHRVSYWTRTVRTRKVGKMQIESYTNALTDLLKQTAVIGKDIADSAWDILLHGVRAEGIVILLITIVSGLLLWKGLHLIISSLPRLAAKRDTVLGILGLFAAFSVYQLRNALLMVITPDYYIVKTLVASGTSIASGTNSSIDSGVLNSLWNAVPPTSGLIVKFVVVILAVGVVIFLAREKKTV